jgi:hypothetical protein
MENLNKIFKKELNGKTIKIDFKKEFVLTEDEIIIIKFWLKRQHQEYRLPIILPVSQNFCLDFIGWDNYNDVLLIPFKKTFLKW